MNSTKNGNGNGQSIWVESLWVTRKESITLVDGDDVVSREISVGMTVKSENRTSSAVMHESLNRALTGLIEKEKAVWLEAEIMKRELKSTKKTNNDLDAFLCGNYQVVDPESTSPKTTSNVAPMTSRNSSTKVPAKAATEASSNDDAIPF